MKKILREYRIEIVALLLVLLGVFLLVERLEIRKLAYAAFMQSVAFLRQAGAFVKDGLLAYTASFTLSDLLGWILIILASIFIVWRIRYRFSRSSYWTADICPRCGSDLHRIHRTWLDRLLSWILLPQARRYRCSESKCGWVGLRRRKHKQL